MNDTTIHAGIIGGSGYTGMELLRLLARHPRARATRVTSTTYAGQPVAEVFPSLRGATDLAFSAAQPDTLPDELAGCDVVFSATPNGVAMNFAAALLDAGVKLIDLSADFRLQDAAVWAQWYGQPHACPELLPEAVYGLPELHRARIKEARLVANPGCYPTAVDLGFLPLVERGLVDTGHLIADAKSGVSGAGRKAALATALGEASDSFKAYAVPGHRHSPEITQELSAAAGRPVELLFVPHLLPIIRGIHATLYARLLDGGDGDGVDGGDGDGVDAGDLQALYETRFAGEPFVDVLPPGAHPDTRSARGGNTCRIAVHRPAAGRTAVVLAVIDNLVKGAAGQAVQNMNLMFGLPEAAGLEQVALVP